MVHLLAVGHVLHIIYYAYLGQGVLSPRLVIVQRPVKVPPAMCPAAYGYDSLKFLQDTVAGITVSLYGPVEVLEELQDHLRTPCPFIVKEEHQAVHHIPDQPEISFDRPVFLTVDYRDRRLVGLYIIGSQYQFLEPEVGGSHQVGDIMEPSLYCGGRYAEAQTFEHLDLAVERKVVDIFPHHQVCQQGGARIAFGYGLVLYGCGTYQFVRFSYTFMTDGDTDVQFGRLQLQMLGSLRVAEEYPFILMTDIAFRIYMFLHMAQFCRQLPAHGDSFLTRLGCTGAPVSVYLLKSLSDCICLLFGHIGLFKIQTELVGVIGDAALFRHRPPHFALQVKQLLFQPEDIFVLFLDDTSFLFDVPLLLGDQALVFLLEHPGIRQLLHKLFGSVGTSVLGVTVKQQPADKGWFDGTFRHVFCSLFRI